MARQILSIALAVFMISSVGAQEKNPVVLIKTSLGDIKVELDAQKAPISTKNFLSYVDEKFYNGTVFHRVIENFMIQGGGFEPGMREKQTKAPIKNESGNGLSNVRGSIAMARTNVLDSATSQFYINTENNPNLDPAKYCVFGKVIEGMETVDKIRKVETSFKMGHGDVPKTDVVIQSVTVVK